MSYYDKSLADDFSGSFCSDNWKKEILASSITIAFDYVETSGDLIRSYFKAELTGDNLTTFNTLPAQHNPTPAPVTVQTQIINEDKTLWHQALTSAKTPINLPNNIPPGYVAYITGAFDNPTTKTLGDGDQMVVEKTDEGEASLSGRFIEHFYVINGSYHDDNADIRDWVSMHLYAEASVPAVAEGDGNAAKIPVGTEMNIIVPATGDGDWDVDGETLEAGEINKDLVPLPAYDADGNPNGYWDWDPDATPSITPAAGNGGYNLFDFAVGIIGRQANRLPLKNGCENCVPPNVKGKKILPHWQVVFTLHRHVDGTSAVAFEMKVARKNTV